MRADNRQIGQGEIVAVLPIENLSGTSTPLKEIRQSFVGALRSRGFRVIGDDVIEKFMARHRIRYIGGLDTEASRAFRDEEKVSGVFITSIGLNSATTLPPKFAVTSRFVSTGESPGIVWMDTVSVSGDDSPGLLGLGMIEDPKQLREKAIQLLVQSLADNLSDVRKTVAVPARFRPKVAFRSPGLAPDRKYVVAVVPFFNRSDRKNAAELLALQFVGQLGNSGVFSVIEPGLVREKLLKFRIIMDQGLSLPDADTLFNSLDADLILTGYVVDYQDYLGYSGRPKVDFFISLLEKKSREVVWASSSYNEGDDGVFFFDRGKIGTAGALAGQMTKAVVNAMVKK